MWCPYSCLYMRWRKKDIMGSATIGGIGNFTQSSTETTAEVPAVISWTVVRTQSRMVGDHYEVKVDGEWTPVPNDRINNVVAPDGGAHVCAPRQEGLNKGVVFCVVLPPEG